jgi:hypothetical protein
MFLSATGQDHEFTEFTIRLPRIGQAVTPEAAG